VGVNAFGSDPCVRSFAAGSWQTKGGDRESGWELGATFTEMGGRSAVGAAKLVPAGS
jgi:hypothetical protein